MEQLKDRLGSQTVSGVSKDTVVPGIPTLGLPLFIANPLRDCDLQVMSLALANRPFGFALIGVLADGGSQ